MSDTKCSAQCNKMFPTNGKRNSRDLATGTHQDGENFALLANSNEGEGGGGGGGGGDDVDKHLDAIELAGSIRNGEFIAK